MPHFLLKCAFLSLKLPFRPSAAALRPRFEAGSKLGFIHLRFLKSVCRLKMTGKFSAGKNGDGGADDSGFCRGPAGEFHADEADIILKLLVGGEGADGFQQVVEHFAGGFVEMVLHVHQQPLLRI